MAAKKKQVTGGVDTHSETHHAAVVDRDPLHSNGIDRRRPCCV
jgi:hypothetical protein